MARTVNGVSGIWHAAKIICRLVGRFGTAALSDATTPEIATAVLALVTACQAFEALDDHPTEIDHTSGGVEDVPFG